MDNAGTGTKKKPSFKSFAENFPQQDYKPQQPVAAPQFNVADVRDYVNQNKINKRLGGDTRSLLRK